MRRLRRFWALPRAERRVALAGLFLLGWAGLVLRVAGFSRASRLAAGPLGLVAGAVPDPQRVGYLVNAVAPLVRANCLVRSLAAAWLLRRRGVAALLCVGVSRIGGGLSAHAWVEVDGAPVNDAPDVRGRFHVLPTLGDGGAALRNAGFAA